MHLNVFKNVTKPLWWQHITVEPAILFFFTTYIMIDQVNVNLYLQKACRINATSEPNLNTPCDDETRGIIFVSHVNSEYKFFLTLIMTGIVALASSWSDETGKKRKVLMIIPIIGQILQITSSCFQSYFWQWPPTVAVVSDFVFQVICGGHMLILNCAGMYISDITSVENRTTRYGILSMVILLCLPIGSGLAGILMKSIGFLCTYLLGLVLSLISLMFMIALVNDVAEPVEKKTSFYEFFNVLRIFKSFKIFSKSSLRKNRIVVLLLIVIHVLVWFTQEGEKSILYLYLRHKFKWDERVFGLYLMYKLIGILCGLSFCTIVLSKIFKIHDGLIGSIAGFWDMIAVLCYFFANQTWQLYLIPLLHVFQYAAISVHYSFISKYFDSHEFGQLTSALNTVGILIPICHPIYSITFQMTLNTIPSAVFLISVVINLGVCLLYGVAYYLCRKKSKSLL